MYIWMFLNVSLRVHCKIVGIAWFQQSGVLWDDWSHAVDYAHLMIWSVVLIGHRWPYCMFSLSVKLSHVSFVYQQTVSWLPEWGVRSWGKAQVIKGSDVWSYEIHFQCDTIKWKSVCTKDHGREGEFYDLQVLDCLKHSILACLLKLSSF